MPDQNPPDNPFAASHSQRPFAGRQMIFNRIQQHITGGAAPFAPLIVGRRNSGKSALLHQFNGFMHDSSIGVYLPLLEIKPDDEETWLQAVYDALQDALTPFNIPATANDDDTSSFAEWLRDQYLPAVYRGIRRHRRLILLLDDADHLTFDDAFAYLQSLIGSQCAVILTADVAYDDDLTQFAPIVKENLVFRLGNLDAEASRDLFKSAHIALDDDAHHLIMQSSGGQPDILSAFGYYLYPARGELVDVEAVKAVQKRVYTAFEPDFYARWQKLDLNERLVLTGISGLFYAAPTRPITIQRLEQWLIETDYPLDLTSIRAAVRSLGYRELVASHADQSLQITPGLMQRWLIDNARLHDDITPTRPPRLLIAAAIAICAILLVLVIIIAQGNAGGATPDAAIPTLTLEG
jgi:energy-coupling factor transporter ATP-binding protein EcfA2